MSDLCEYTEDESLCSLDDPYPCGPCQKLAEMQKKIKKVMKALECLKQECQRLKEQAQQKHADEPYIHRLPIEVTADIFTLCIPDEVTTMHVPLCLSAICGHWRTIAHSTPQLWNHLGLQIIETGHLKFKIPSSLLLEEWTNRSGDLPLSINFYANLRPHSFRCYEEDGTMDRIIQMINVLNKQSGRWRELIYSGSPQLLDLFSDNTAVPQQLRTLHVSGIPGYLINPEFNFHPTRLDALSVSGTQLVAIFQLDLNHLTELTLDDVLPSECVEALRRAPHLKRCIFRKFRREIPNEIIVPLPLVSIVHARIEHLEFIGNNVLYRILEQLACPSLKTLLLDSAGELDFYDNSEMELEISLVIGFLRQSKCPLEKLLLRKFTLRSIDFAATLYEELPMIQTLDFSFNFSSDLGPILNPLTEFLTVNGRKQPRYLPSLRSFALRTDSFQDWTTLADIFGTRRAPEHSVELHRDLLKDVTISIQVFFWDSGKEKMNEETIKSVQGLLASADVRWNIRVGSVMGGDWKQL